VKFDMPFNNYFGIVIFLQGPIKHLCVTQLKLLSNGLVEDALSAEFIMTEAFAMEKDGKKIDTKRGETEGLRIKFESFFDEAMESTENRKRTHSLSFSTVN